MILNKHFDWLLFFLAVVITILGTVTILSVNQSVFVSQCIYFVLALIVFLIVSNLDIRIFENFDRFFYLLTLVFLVIPFFFGVFSRGAARWIQIGPKTLQPSEFAKPLLTIFFAKFWSENKINLKTLLICLFLTFIPAYLIFRQPDLGSSLVVISIIFGIILASEITLKQLAIFLLVFLSVLPFSWFILKDYQKLRIEHFLNPTTDPLGAGYNVIQSVITVGSGSFLGKGLGRGTQSHLAFLPERHTDFIFASFAEEFGFIGCLCLLVLYYFLLKRILYIAHNSKNRFGYYFCLGTFVYIFFQTVVNIGMNLGAIPITGITLPLFSYGGSSLISTMICLGLVASQASASKSDEGLTIGIRN